MVQSSFPLFAKSVSFFKVRPLHPVALLLILASWLGTAGNLPLWTAILRLPEINSLRAVAGAAGLVFALVAFLFATLCLLAWSRWLKWLGILFMLVTTSASYFMFSYGVVIDASMMANTLNTDLREVRDLLAPGMLPALVLGLVLPGWWLWQQPMLRPPLRRLLPWQLGWGVFGLLLTVGTLALSFQDLASLMRNHKSLRYMINPYNTVYAIAHHGLSQTRKANAPLQPLGLDAHLVIPASSADQRPLIVMVVGETARAANFGLGGYARDTTPKLSALQQEGGLIYFPQVTSCGTNTQTSLPCMFSHLGREAYIASEERYENLLDILQRSGLAVLWLDNQSGCKGVCERVPHADVQALLPEGSCPEGECDDLAFLKVLPKQLQTLEETHQARGTVLVLHQMGSHGPAYYKRSPDRLKAFQPECTSHTLQDCSMQQIINAYDNSLRTTDEMLAGTVDWLKSQQRPTALVYVSDHGESLGEKGLYLHGMPYRLAPQEQKHVPMLFWSSAAYDKAIGLDHSCLKEQQAQKPWSHDNLIHTMLDLARVQTQVQDRGKSILSGCLGAHV